MKKFVAVILSVMLICAFASAETVYVTISDDQGQLAVAAEPIDVSDIDADGTITIYDAVYAAHDFAYEGGAGAGFKTEDTDYGKSIVALWGIENGGSYGYYVNNASAYSLTDPVAEGDHVQAYAFTDLEAWSDTFCYFDKLTVEKEDSFELILTAQTYDANWNEVLVPVEGAEITIDGSASGIITDSAGKALIEISESGEYVISAVSESMTLVPPVCIAKIG